jgi:two-component system, OmpR family, response regulator ResD
VTETERECVRALVVDDDPAIVEMVATTLSLEGFEVDTCGDGLAALAHVTTRPPDVIVLDVMLPGLDGLSVLSQLRSDPQHEFIPVVIMSALASDDEVWSGWRLGADSYVTKPFDPAALTTEVMRVLTPLPASDTR